MHCSEQEIEDLLHYQIGALDGICRAQGTRVSYVKPHGALYNDMMREPRLLHAVMRAIAAYDPDLPLVVLARSDNSEVTAIAASHGLQLMFEAFADLEMVEGFDMSPFRRKMRRSFRARGDTGFYCFDRPDYTQQFILPERFVGVV